MAARQGRYAEASAYYEKTLARDPDRLDALVQLGIPGPVRLEGWFAALLLAPRAPAGPVARPAGLPPLVTSDAC